MPETDCPSPEALQALVAGALAPAERDPLLAHVDGCDECHAIVAALGAEVRATAATEPDDGTSRSHALLARGSDVDRYRIDSPLGMGGMGVVYLAHDPELDRKVAVKLLRRTSEGSIERLRREGRALAALSHPNVVAIHDVGEYAGALFIAMELVDGPNLRGWLTAKRRGWREIVEIALAAGRGLEAAHIAGLVHRDIKPDNILVGADGRVRVGDFGLVDALPSGEAAGDVELTQTGALLGTPAYMSPEQLDGGEVDARSDQWSFCATLFEALYGVRAFAGKSVDELSLSIEDGEIAETKRTGVPRWLRRVIVRGLAVEPRARWASMRALCDAIERGHRRRKQLLVVGPVALLALAGGGVWMATRPVPVDCSDAGAVPLAAWSPAKRALITANNPGLIGELDHWISDWSSARAEACTTNVADDDTRTRRTACLDHQLDRLVAVADGWQTTKDHHVLNDVFDLRDVMPSLSACSQAAIAGTPEPTPAQHAAVVAVEHDLLDMLLLRRGGDLASATRIGTELLAKAKASGYAPAIVDVAALLAPYQDTAYDIEGAEATYRTGLEAAELAHDEGAKALFGLRLAEKLGDNKKATEAKHFFDLAKASAARLPPSPLIDAAMAEAEALVLQAANDFRGEVAALRRFIALRTSVFGELDSQARHQMPLLALALDQYDVSEAGKVREQIDKLDAKLGFDEARELERTFPKMMEQAFHQLQSGDAAAAAKTYEAMAAMGDSAVGDSPRIAEWRQGAGVMADAAGDLERAFTQYTRAIVMWDRFAIGSQVVEQTLLSTARVLCGLARYRDAVGYAQRAIDLSAAIHLDDATADARVGLGEALLGLGDLAGARAPLEQAVAWREDQGNAGSRGKAKVLLARALWAGSAIDRKRALELARIGRTDIATAVAKLAPKDPFTRYARAPLDKLLADTDAWLRAHP